MVSSRNFLVAAFVAAAQLASAQTPPGCLLAAINTQTNPADIKTICGKSSDLNTEINKVCGPNNYQSAKDAFNKVCKDAGVQVTLSGGPTTSTTSTSGSSTATTTGTATTTTAQNAVVTSSRTSSGSSSTPTGAADRNGVVGLSMGAFAVLGMAAAL